MGSMDTGEADKKNALMIEWVAELELEQGLHLLPFALIPPLSVARSDCNAQGLLAWPPDPAGKPEEIRSCLVSFFPLCEKNKPRGFVCLSA